MALAGDCSTLWSIRLANPQTPDSFFRGWHAITNDTDTSCCQRFPPWSGIYCTSNRVDQIILDGASLGDPTQLINTIPASISALTMLSILELRTTNVVSLPDVFASLPNFATLQVDRSPPFASLPPSLFRTQLGILTLRQTTLTQVPAQIASVGPTLQILFIVDSKIQALPDVFQSFSKLDRIDLSDNPITVLPPSLANAPLHELYIANTSVTDISAVCGMTSLVTLVAISNTRLRSLGCSFSNLQNLRMALFSDSALSTFTAFDYCARQQGGCPNMQTLLLNNNKVLFCSIFRCFSLNACLYSCCSFLHHLSSIIDPFLCSSQPSPRAHSLCPMPPSTSHTTTSPRSARRRRCRSSSIYRETTSPMCTCCWTPARMHCWI